MKIELDLTVGNDVLSEASAKFGKEIAEAAGQDYEQDKEKYLELGFKKLKAQMEAEANKAALDVLVQN